MTFQHRIDSARQQTLAQLASARVSYLAALEPDAPNRLSWHGAAFYVDQTRRLVVPQSVVDREDVAGPTLPATSRLVARYGTSAQSISSEDLIRVMAHLVTDRTRQLPWAVSGSQLLGLAVAQPSVDPAFGPLFWLALADTMRDGPRSELQQIVGPLMLELATYPASRATAHAVRRAQGVFVMRFDPARGRDAEEQPDATWLATCEAVLADRHDHVDQHVFREVAALAVRLDRSWQ